MTAASPTSSERMIEPELLITGEAVALEITPAPIASPRDSSTTPSMPWGQDCPWSW